MSKKKTKKNLRKQTNGGEFDWQLLVPLHVYTQQNEPNWLFAFTFVDVFFTALRNLPVLFITQKLQVQVNSPPQQNWIKLNANKCGAKKNLACHVSETIREEEEEKGGQVFNIWLLYFHQKRREEFSRKFSTRQLFSFNKNTRKRYESYHKQRVDASRASWLLIVRTF